MIQLQSNNNLVAYFSMEIGFDPEIPTYAGGLGVLAGDILRSFADQGLQGLGVTLLSEFGYFTQEIEESKKQIEHYHRWEPEKFLELLEPEVTVSAGDDTIYIRIWQYTITGLHGSKVPIIYLDTNHEKNSNEYKRLTQRLYPANPNFRLLQEIILGIGGAKALEALGYNPAIYHLNEGHPAFLTLELLRNKLKSDKKHALDQVRQQCVFTTHTPVEAGHDRFPNSLIENLLAPEYVKLLETIPDIYEGENLNMTKLALSTSGKMNGVARKHAEVSKQMFPKYDFSAITNGVHHNFWTSPPLYVLYDDFLPGWQKDPFALLGVSNIPAELIGEAHEDNKRRLVNYIRKTSQHNFSPDVFTIGYARRFTKYKRPDLLFYDLDRLQHIAEKYPMQIVFAGKAHPSDTVGKSLISEILSLSEKLKPHIKLTFIENYDINLAKLIISGSDLWLNTPTRPREASGTSGMKASLNGVPNLSILDGWWLEGHIEGVTGWSIGTNPLRQHEDFEIACDDCDDAEDMYNKLEREILPMYYENRGKYVRIGRNAIALHGSYFNTHRVVQQYVLKSYLL